MLDNYFLGPAKEYKPYVKTVVEKKAPTDQSIKLYAEIKEKAYDSILKSIEIHNNLFSASAIVYKDFLSLSYKCKYVFELNGEEFKGELKLNANRLDDSEYKATEDIINMISRNITKSLTEAVFKGVKQT